MQFDTWSEDSRQQQPSEPSWQISYGDADEPRSPASVDRADAASPTGLLQAIRQRAGLDAEEEARAAQQQRGGGPLAIEARAAETTGSFIFAHRQLQEAERPELPVYLRESCTAKFVDLSCLGDWDQATFLAVAAAVKHSMRAARSLVLDGNNVGGRSEVLEAWCSALEEHPGLQHVSLRDAGLDDAGAERLAQTLRGHSVLFSLDLSRNRIGDAGMAALAEALEENHTLLELGVEGTDAGEDTRHGLALVLQRNASHLSGHGSPARLLRSLRRAKAEASTSSAQLAGGAMETSQLASGTQHWAPFPPLSASVPVQAPRRLPPSDPADDAHALGLAHSVFFSAENHVSATLVEELARRCEAGWRYTASDREVLCELRNRIADLRCLRRQERERGDEVQERVAAAQQSFRERLAPREQQIIQLKEELADIVESTKSLLRSTIQKKVELKSLMDELQTFEQQKYHDEVTAQKQINDLKMRHREVVEESQTMECDLHIMEEKCARLDTDNERSRRLLHAVRFETDFERFVPSWVEKDTLLEGAAPTAPPARLAAAGS